MSATQSAITAAVNSVLSLEGGYVDNRADKGGPTNMGITLPTLSIYLGRQATLNELTALTQETARNIYSKLYVYNPGFVAINDPRVLLLLVDCAVNHGTVCPVEWVQSALPGLAVDGHFGPITANAVNVTAPRTVYTALLVARTEFYGQIITANPTQAVFASEWMKRLARFFSYMP